MKKLVLVALAVGGMAITGCTTEEGGYFDVTWNLTDSDNAATTCGPALTARVTARGGATGTDFIDLFNCDAGGGLTALLPLDNYLVWVDFLDANNTIVAQSFSQANQSIDLDGEAVPVGFNVVMDGGFFQLAWDITDGGSPSDCATEGSGGVEIASTLSGTTEAVTDIFNCTDGTGTTAAVPIGDYVVSIALLDTNDPAGALDIIDSTNESITFGNELVDLGTVVFDPQ